MYDVRALLHREPARIKAAITVTLGALVISDLITLSGEAVAAWAVAFEVVLGLFYVRRQVTPTTDVVSDSTPR